MVDGNILECESGLYFHQCSILCGFSGDHTVFGYDTIGNQQISYRNAVRRETIRKSQRGAHFIAGCVFCQDIVRKELFCFLQDRFCFGTGIVPFAKCQRDGVLS